MKRSLSAFTLVELAIVIVIIGLLVGGVLQGQELITQAKIRKTISDVKGYDAAIATFYSKYNAMPGDMINATQYWGQVSGGCTYQLGTGTQTCNGDGNKVVNYEDGWDKATTRHEGIRVWQHLSNAGVIKGSYTGSSTCAPGAYACYYTGINAPSGSFEGTVWAFWNVEGSWYWTGKAATRHIYALGRNLTNYRWYNVSMIPLNQRVLDEKIDDGKPWTGIVTNVSDSAVTGNCATSAAATADYNVTYNGLACIPFIDAVIN